MATDRLSRPTLERPHRPKSRAALGLHTGLVLGVCLCVGASWFELTRARAGRTVAWVYVVEWPLFAVFGIYIWWRLWREQSRGVPHAGEAGLASSDPAAQREVPVDDPQLVAWQQYVRNLQTLDPPGGPPEISR